MTHVAIPVITVIIKYMIYIFQHLINIASSMWPYLIGYAYTVIAGGIIVKNIMGELKKEVRLGFFREDTERISYSWYAEHIGYIDSILYLTALLCKWPEFIAVWLAFKVAGRWESAKMEADIITKNSKALDTKTKITNNALYNIFTIGNAFVLIYATTGWKIVQWLQDNQFDKAFLVGIGVLLLSYIFYKQATKQTFRLRGIFSKQK